MEDTSFFEKINKQDGSRDAALEAKHTPFIIVDSSPKKGQTFSLTIDVGKDKHPNINGHFIEWVDLYSEWVFLTRVAFSAVTTAPKVTVQITLDKAGETTLRAFAKCNLHGVWEGSTKIGIN